MDQQLWCRWVLSGTLCTCWCIMEANIPCETDSKVPLLLSVTGELYCDLMVIWKFQNLVLICFGTEKNMWIFYFHRCSECVLSQTLVTRVLVPVVGKEHSHSFPLLFERQREMMAVKDLDLPLSCTLQNLHQNPGHLFLPSPAELEIYSQTLPKEVTEIYQWTIIALPQNILLEWKG